MVRLRIAVWHNLPSGGGKRALYDHVDGLVARGHHVECWCPPTANATYLPLSRLAPEHVVGLEWPMPFRRLDEFQITLEMDRALASMEKHCLACAAQIEPGGFDVLFVNSCQFFATSPIGRFVTIPSVVYLGEPYRPLYEAKPRLRWLARSPPFGSRFDPSTYRAAFADLRRIRNWRVQARAEVDNAAAFGGILVNSYFSRESVLRAYGLESEVCYLGIDTDRFADHGLPREDFVVGLGSITAEKGVHRCIEAIAAMQAPRPRLVWIGNFADSVYLSLMRNLAEQHAVVFEPQIDITDAALLNTLGRAMAMVYAARLEPFGLAPLEAAACCTPVVAMAEGGVRETIVHDVTGLLVDSDPLEMAAALENLRRNPDHTRAFAERAGAAVAMRWGKGQATDRIEQALLRHARSS